LSSYLVTVISVAQLGLFLLGPSQHRIAQLKVKESSPSVTCPSPLTGMEPVTPHRGHSQSLSSFSSLSPAQPLFSHNSCIVSPPQLAMSLSSTVYCLHILIMSVHISFILYLFNRGFRHTCSLFTILMSSTLYSLFHCSCLFHRAACFIIQFFFLFHAHYFSIFSLLLLHINAITDIRHSHATCLSVQCRQPQRARSFSSAVFFLLRLFQRLPGCFSSTISFSPVGWQSSLFVRLFPLAIVFSCVWRAGFLLLCFKGFSVTFLPFFCCIVGCTFHSPSWYYHFILLPPEPFLLHCTDALCFSFPRLLVLLLPLTLSLLLILSEFLLPTLPSWSSSFTQFTIFSFILPYSFLIFSSFIVFTPVFHFIRVPFIYLPSSLRGSVCKRYTFPCLLFVTSSSPFQVILLSILVS